MFSPYYARARARGGAAAEDHVAINVALHGAGRNDWCMTERGRAALARDADTLAVGPSAMRWCGDCLRVTIDEITCPWPRRLRGEVRFHPAAWTGRRLALDAAGRHVWTPFAPLGRVEVEMRSPAVRWSGHGYLDGNHGAEPLEAAFRDWSWSRATLPGGRAAVLYDAARRDGGATRLALLFDVDGRSEEFNAPPRTSLPRSGWRIPRPTRAEQGRAALRRTLVDAPFYARSVITTQLLGDEVTAVHESLSLDRFAHPLVQAMLPFRMPRRAR